MNIRYKIEYQDGTDWREWKPCEWIWKDMNAALDEARYHAKQSIVKWRVVEHTSKVVATVDAMKVKHE